MQGRIDPENGALLDVDGATPRTLAELRQINPPCPRCGTPISVEARLMQPFEGSGPTDLYQFGRHKFHCNCWNGSAE